jgi:antitoxin HicB
MTEYLIPISIRPLKEGGFLATSPHLQGLIAEGRTIAESLEIAEDVARKIIESRIEHNEPLPDSLIAPAAKNAKFNTRIPVPLEI